MGRRHLLKRPHSLGTANSAAVDWRLDKRNADRSAAAHRNKPTHARRNTSNRPAAVLLLFLALIAASDEIAATCCCGATTVVGMTSLLAAEVAQIVARAAAADCGVRGHQRPNHGGTPRTGRRRCDGLYGCAVVGRTADELLRF